MPTLPGSRTLSAYVVRGKSNSNPESPECLTRWGLSIDLPHRFEKGMLVVDATIQEKRSNRVHSGFTNSEENQRERIPSRGFTPGYVVNRVLRGLLDALLMRATLEPSEARAKAPGV